MFYFNSNNLCNGGEMVKKIGLIMLMMIACIMPINANSISVELQDSVDELSKENVEFNVVQVAKLVDGFYVLNEEFQDLDVDFNTELLAEEVEAICTKLSGYSMVGQTLVTDEEGKAVLEDVEEGLYFIDPVNINEYERMSPMLVSVPEWDGDTLNYDVLMYPKHRPFEKLIIKKIDKVPGGRRDLPLRVSGGSFPGNRWLPPVHNGRCRRLRVAYPTGHRLDGAVPR